MHYKGARLLHQACASFRCSTTDMSVRPRGTREAPVAGELTRVSLGTVETAAAMLEEEEAPVKPIQWLNVAHHQVLKTSNRYTSDLARRLDAYSECAKADKVEAM